ncbi:MAG: NIPSNAP family protein [Pseudomonadota bacterium]
MIHELRIYEIFDNTREAFHARFRDHAARLMADHGFTILAMWEAETDRGPEFVYLLAWPDDATRQEAWKTFMANPEWQRIKRDTAAAAPGDLVGEVSSRVLAPAGYGPELGGALD